MIRPDSRTLPIGAGKRGFARIEGGAIRVGSSWGRRSRWPPNQLKHAVLPVAARIGVGHHLDRGDPFRVLVAELGRGAQAAAGSRTDRRSASRAYFRSPKSSCGCSAPSPCRCCRDRCSRALEGDIFGAEIRRRCARGSGAGFTPDHCPI